MPTPHRLVPLSLVAALSLGFAAQAGATAISVTVADDPVGASCPGVNCSLRAAVLAANTGDEVDLFATTYTLTQGAAVTNNPGQNVKIVGEGARDTIIDASGNGANAAFSFTNGPEIDDVTITGAQASAIALNGNLTLNRDSLHDNSNASGGGAVNAIFGQVTIDASVFYDNTAGTNGGSGANGGALYNQSGNGNLGFTITNSTFTANHAVGTGARGGAIDEVAGNVTLTNVTIAGNDADSGGGGVQMEAGTINNHVNATNLILSDNTSTTGGGNCGRTGSGDFILLADTIVHGDQAECTRNTATLNTQLTANPELFPLDNYGGPTDTMPIDSDGAAKDAGVVGGTATDQRGVARPQGAGKDIGAFELVQSGDLGIVKSGPLGPVNVGDPVVYTLTVSATGPADDGAYPTTVTDTLPANVAYVSAVASQGNCNFAAGTVTCDLGFVANGTSPTVTITTNATGPGLLITNTATVTSFRPQTSLLNDGSTALTTLNPAPVGGGSLPFSAPVVKSLGASTGGPGMALVIDGDGFAGVTQVLFGDVPAFFTVNGFQKITAIVPAGAGAVDVRVVNPVGTSPLSGADNFTYATEVAPPVPEGPEVLCTVPSLRGHTYRGSKHLLERAGCGGVLFHRGHARRLPSHVKSQTPAAGVPLHEGERVFAVLG